MPDHRFIEYQTDEELAELPFERRYLLMRDAEMVCEDLNKQVRQLRAEASLARGRATGADQAADSLSADAKEAYELASRIRKSLDQDLPKPE